MDGGVGVYGTAIVGAEEGSDGDEVVVQDCVGADIAGVSVGLKGEG